MAEKNKHPKYHLKLLEPIQQSNLKYKIYIYIYTQYISLHKTKSIFIMERITIYNDILY